MNTDTIKRMITRRIERHRANAVDIETNRFTHRHATESRAAALVLENLLADIENFETAATEEL